MYPFRDTIRVSPHHSLLSRKQQGKGFCAPRPSKPVVAVAVAVAVIMAKGWASIVGKFLDGLGFAAPRKVIFADWRIVGVYLTLLGVTIYYCYLTAIEAQGYLYKEIPSGDIAIFASSGNHSASSRAIYDKMKAAGGAGASYEYCNNPAYDYTWSAGFKYQNLSCAFLHSDLISSKIGSSISFTTSFTNTRYVAKPNAASSAGCKQACVGVGDATWNGACRCSDSKNFFVVAPEEMSVNFLSYFSWSRKDGLPSRTLAVSGEGTTAKPFKRLCFDPPGLDANNPACTVKEKTVSAPVQGKGRANYLVFPVKDLLALAEADLDKTPEDCAYKPGNPLPDQEGYACRTQSTNTQELIIKNQTVRGSSSTEPKTRLTGLTISIEAKYYNRRQAYIAFGGIVGEKPLLSTDDHHDDYVCVLKIKPYYQWTSAKGHEVQDADAFVVGGGEPDAHTTSVTYRYGVLFTFSSTGLVADYDPNAVLLYIVTLIVFVGFAHTVANIIATKSHYLLKIPGIEKILSSTMIGAYIQGLVQRTKTYDTFENFHVDARKSYAKYGVQAVVASIAFKALDKDGTGLVSAKEFNQYLNDMLAPVGFDSDKVKKLVGYIFAECNHDDDGSVLPEDDETVSINEFIEIFTEDFATIERLKDIIKADDAVAKVDGVIVNWMQEKFGSKTDPKSRETKLTKIRSKKSMDRSHANVNVQGA